MFLSVAVVKIFDDKDAKVGIWIDVQHKPFSVRMYGLENTPKCIGHYSMVHGGYCGAQNDGKCCGANVVFGTNLAYSNWEESITVKDIIILDRNVTDLYNCKSFIIIRCKIICIVVVKTMFHSFSQPGQTLKFKLVSTKYTHQLFLDDVMIIESWPYLHNGQYGYEHKEGRTGSDVVLRKFVLYAHASFPTPLFMKWAYLLSVKWAYGTKE